MTKRPGADASLAEWLAACAPGDVQTALGLLELDEDALRWLWPFWARGGQMPPPGDWAIWLMMAGRGFGKTRAGAEWVRAMAAEYPGCAIALVGATAGEARSVMVEGVSGLLAVSPETEQLLWAPSLGRLRWGNGSQAVLFSAAEPDSLRGPEFHFAWADEVAKWHRAETAWDTLMLALRKGSRPRALATTTPRAIPLMRRLAADPRVARTRGATADNAAHLPPVFLAEMARAYGGTRLGRQELGGELIEEVAGALWTRGGIEARRVAAAPELVRVVIGVDPPATSEGDACGIVAVGLGADGAAYVLEDASVENASPETWARAVSAAVARHEAERVIAEVNNGGEMVRSVLEAADIGLAVKMVHARRGKSARAEPVAALYERGRAFHAGAFPALEDQLCGMLGAGGYEGPGRSPDRADALVWAMTELMLGRRAAPRVRAV